MDWNKTLASWWIKVLHKDEHNLVLETTKLLDTLFFVSSLNRWRIGRIQEDDIYIDGKRIEKNILYYYK